MTSGRWRQWGGAPANEGRLGSRPGPPTEPASSGLQRLGLGGERDGLLYVPAGYSPDQPAPFVLMLHGAGGSASGGLWPFQEHADAEGLVLLAIDSRGPTWDVIRGGYGPDVAFIDRALSHSFARVAVNPARVAIEGFSDGASYALSLGLTNGDLFTHIVAFSPGFAAPADQIGQPRIYISHGVHDEVLPIDRCSRRLVPMIQGAGYDVRYREFDDGHTIPPEITHEALDWLR
ncbi:MAG: phospholipase [Chloroflexota bacterium]|nr:phospholipase [Chloroflexota bacterium]